MPKKVNHEDRRLALAEAAVKVIARVGIDKLRLVDVAKEVGATTGLVTHYLGDKDAVLQAALDYVATELLSQDAECLSIDDLWRQLFETLPVDKPGRNHWKVWLAYWGRAVNNTELGEIHKSYNQEFHRGLVELLSEKLPRRRDMSVDEMADMIITTVDGIGANAVVDVWPADKQRRQLSLMLTPILGPPPGA